MTVNDVLTAMDTIPAVDPETEMVCLELDKLLSTALAMAKYFGHRATMNAILVALEVNEIVADGQRNDE